MSLVTGVLVLFPFSMISELLRTLPLLKCRVISFANKFIFQNMHFLRYKVPAHIHCTVYAWPHLEGGATQPALLVVGNVLINVEHAGAVGVQVVLQVVSLLQHGLAHLVETAGRDQMALTVDLPSNGSERRAHLVITRGSGGGTRVVSDVNSSGAILDHSVEKIRVVVRFIVDDGESLGLDANLLVGSGNDIVPAKDTVVEWCLVLPGSVASTSGTVGPMDLVGLSNHHTNAVLPLVSVGKPGVVLVVEAALVSFATFMEINGSYTVLVVFTDREMFGSKMPMDIDRAQAGFTVVLGDRNGSGVELALVSLGDVGS